MSTLKYTASRILTFTSHVHFRPGKYDAICISSVPQFERTIVLPHPRNIKR